MEILSKWDRYYNVLYILYTLCIEYMYIYTFIDIQVYLRGQSPLTSNLPSLPALGQAFHRRSPGCGWRLLVSLRPGGGGSAPRSHLAALQGPGDLPVDWENGGMTWGIDRFFFGRTMFHCRATCHEAFKHHEQISPMNSGYE